MRLHLRPLGVCQYESFHLKLESQPSRGWNPDSQQTLGYARRDSRYLREPGEKVSPERHHDSG
jgi:hypothetical protein